MDDVRDIRIDQAENQHRLRQPGWQKRPLRLLMCGLVVALAAFFPSQGFAQVSPLEGTRYYNQGIEYYQKGDWAQSVSLFEKSVAADPTRPDAFYNLGSVYYKLGQYDRAQAAFQQVLTLRPADNEARYNLALTHEKLGNRTSALQLLKQIPPTDRKYPQAQQKLAQWPPPAPRPVATTSTQPANKTSEKAAPEKAVANNKAKPAAPTQKEKASTTKTLSAKPYASGFLGPTGLALAPNGDLFVANYSKNVIYRVPKAKKATPQAPEPEKAVFASGSQLNGPVGLVYDPRTSSLFVANYLKNDVCRISPEGKVSVVATGLNKPYYLYLDALSNTLYVSEQGKNSVSKIQLP